MLLSADESSSLLDQAKILCQKKDCQNATPLFESILSKFPDSPAAKETCLLLSPCYVALNQQEKCESVYLHGISRFSSDSRYVLRLEQSLGDFYLSLKEYDKAIVQYQSALQKRPDCKTMVALTERIVSCRTAGGNPEGAAQALETLLAAYPRLTDEYATDTQNYWYYRVRTQVDQGAFTARTLKRMAELYETAMQPDMAAATRRILIEQHPNSPQAITACYALARYLDAQSSKAEAMPYYLKAIVDSAKPLCLHKALAPDNQLHLDELNNERLSNSDAARAVREIHAILVAANRRDETLSETTLASVRQLWQEAHKQIESANYETAIQAYEKVRGELSNKSCMAELVNFMIASCSFARGEYRQTIADLTPLTKNRSLLRAVAPRDTPQTVFCKTLAHRAAYLTASSYFRLGNYATAEKTVKEIGTTPSPSLLYLLAQCYEFQGKAKEAKAAYQKVSALPDKELAALSLCALKRLDALADNLAGLSGGANSSIRYVGEDRRLQGNWPEMSHRKGSRDFCAILGGMASYVDSVVTYGMKISYKLSIGSPKDSVRRWTSTVNDPCPSALVNPVTKKRKMANWDDHGETYLLGEGPNLFLDIRIPEGIHRLSLYFVNDHNYYEPDRRYTLTVENEDGHVLAATSVEDFLAGVYKHLAVRGPQNLTIRIWRDLSLNTLLSGVFVERLTPPEDFSVTRAVSPQLDALRKEFSLVRKQWEADPLSFYQNPSRAAELRRRILEYDGKETRPDNKLDSTWQLAALSQLLSRYPERNAALREYGWLWQVYADTTSDKGRVLQNLFSSVQHLRTIPWVQDEIQRELTNTYSNALVRYLPEEEAIPALKKLFSWERYPERFVLAKKMADAYSTEILKRYCGEKWVEVMILNNALSARAGGGT